MKNILKPLALMLVFVASYYLISSFTLIENEPELTFSTPGYNGFHVGATLVIEGTSANVKPEQFVWVFARRENFKPLWYPQGEVSMDDSRSSWHQMVYFGNAHDIGYNFDVAVAVFNEQEHLKLLEYWEYAMRTGDWKPIKMPSSVTAPNIRSVLKISH